MTISSFSIRMASIAVTYPATDAPWDPLITVIHRMVRRQQEAKFKTGALKFSSEAMLLCSTESSSLIPIKFRIRVSYPKHKLFIP